MTTGLYANLAPVNHRHGWRAMTRKEATKLADALFEKANHLHYVTRTLRTYLSDSEMIEQWGVAHVVDVHLNRISLASADMNGFVKNVLSQLRIPAAVSLPA